jgi:ABC-2 type transport system permease protein
MRWHRFAAMARKEFLQIFRDSRSLGIVVVMPVVLMMLLGYGVSLDTKRIPTYVFDQENSPQSRDLVARFASTEYFEIRGAASSHAELVAALDSGRAQLALVIPYDFSRRLAHGGAVPVQALVDATDDNTANLIFGYARAIVQGYSQEVLLEFLQRRGRTDVPQPLRVEPRTWFNETLESKHFIVPGVVAIVMAVIGAFLTSLTIAREWERGTMEQLVSTPVTPLEILLGKLVPYFVIGMLDAVLCVVMGIYWFEVPFRGTALALYGSSALFLIAVLAQGYFISVVAKSQLAASQLALVSTFLPSFLLSGFLFAIEQMPPVIQAVTRVLPARYYVSILKNVFLKGTSLELLRNELLALAVFALVLSALARRAFHKSLV